MEPGVELLNTRLEQAYEACALFGIPADQLTKKALIGYITKLHQELGETKRHHFEETAEWLALFRCQRCE